MTNEIPPQIKNRVGEKYKMLTVVEFAGFRQYKTCRQTVWKCLCECGNYKELTAASLLNPTTKSCGCWNKSVTAEHARTVLKRVNTKHGFSQHPLYDAWSAMMSRCYNTEDKDYKNYGARGIKVCDRWHSVSNYIEDLVERPEGMSLDRINVDGNYEPENCKWSSYREQNLNTRYNREFPNVYRDRNSWKVLFHLNGQKYYLGMFKTEALANEALQQKLKEMGCCEE